MSVLSRDPPMVRSMRSALTSFRRPGLDRWFGVVAGGAALSVVVAVISWNAVRLAQGNVSVSELLCVDPTEACNWSSYRVRNDTAAPVVLRECMHHCGLGDQRLDPVFVGSKATTSDDAVTALVGSRNWWEVRTAAHRSLGCLVLDGHRHKRDGYLVLVSSREPCSPGAPSTPAQAPHSIG
jgi:hypothetical protein